MSQQHMPLEEEPRGELSNQMSSPPPDTLPRRSFHLVELLGQQIQFGSRDPATPTSPYRERFRFVLALLLLICAFMLVTLVISAPSGWSFITVFLVVLLAVSVFLLILIVASKLILISREKNRQPKD